MRVKAAQFISNGDSCGICSCWRRPEPRIHCRDGPRSGFRRRAALHQPLVHRRRRIRHGLVRCFCTSKHVTLCYRCCNDVSFCRLLGFVHSITAQCTRPSLLSLSCYFCLKPVACTFRFLYWTLKPRFRCALTDRDKFTQADMSKHF